MEGDASCFIYPFGNYTITTKEPQYEKERSAEERSSRLREEFVRDGMRRAVDAVLLVERHGFPHVLVFQLGPGFWKLPGGELQPGEDVHAGLTRILNTCFAAPQDTGRQWGGAALVAQWWRPNFEQHQYPYVPAHVTKPKEQRMLFLVQLPEKCGLCVPSNHQLQCVPVHDLHDNKESYGAVLSALPLQLSRIHFVKVPASLT